MRTVKVEIECDAKKALERLSLMSARSMNVKPVLYYARGQLMKSNAENFAAGGLPAANGQGMPRSRPQPWPLMIRTGKLLASLNSLFGPPNRIDMMEAEFGTRVEYAKFHQYGTNRMPARKIVFEPAGFARDIASKAASFVANGLEP